MRESIIVARVEKYLSEQGYKTFREVPALTKKIDLIGILDEEVLAVEAKIKNWKTALIQANQNRIFADQVFVALWHQNLPNIKRELFDRFGIGLLSVNGGVDIISHGERSSILHSTLKDRLIQDLEKQDE